MRSSGASALLLVSAVALLQVTVVVVAQELNDTAAPEDFNPPIVGFSPFDFAAFDNTTTVDFSTTSFDNTTATMDMMPLVLFDAPPTTIDTDTTNMTITTATATTLMVDTPVPIYNTLVTSITGTTNTMWNKPIWFRSYRKKFKRTRLRKCRFLDGVAPVNGTTCPVIGTSTWYMCMFGDDQLCEPTTGPLPGLLSGYTGENLGSVHPSVNCMCHDSLWHCAAWKPCETRSTTITKPFDDPNAITSCPMTPPLGSSAICAADLNCPYGTESCCGQTFDNLICRCSAGETFGCFFTDACLAPSCGTLDLAPPPAKLGNGAFCPTSVPMSGDTCPTGLDTTTKCAYGTVCCCGQCSDETTCSCDGSASNLFECSTIAIRCSSTCPVDTLAPPECPVDEPQNGDKCSIPDQSCQYGMSIVDLCIYVYIYCGVVAVVSIFPVWPTFITVLIITTLTFYRKKLLLRQLYS